MRTNVHYILLLIGLIALTGCQTVKGAACGLDQDVQNITNPAANGWDTLKNVDAWMQEHMW